MVIQKKNQDNLQEFLTDRLIDTQINKSGILFASKETSKKLVDVPKLLQTKKITKGIKK